MAQSVLRGPLVLESGRLPDALPGLTGPHRQVAVNSDRVDQIVRNNEHLELRWRDWIPFAPF